MSTSVKTKTCPKCKVVKPLYQFGMRKNYYKTQSGETRTYYYYQSYCTVCRHTDTQTYPAHQPQFDTLPGYYGEDE